MVQIKKEIATINRSGTEKTFENRLISLAAISVLVTALIPVIASNRALSSSRLAPLFGTTNKKLAVCGMRRSFSIAVLRTKIKLVIHDLVPLDKPRIG